MEFKYPKLFSKISIIISFCYACLIGPSAIGQDVNFKSSVLQGDALSFPTSLEFGPDGKLYVAQQFGTIWGYSIVRDDAEPGRGTYTIVESEKIELIAKNTPNHNDDGVPTTIKQRQVTGIVTAGTASNPILYVSSSDNLIGGGGSANDTNLDTNSGVISRLTWNGASWDKVDLIRGLPRCEENHATNGMDTFEKNGNNYLLVQQGGHSNKGAPSNNFVGTPEYFLSSALLIVNLTQLESMPIYTDPRSSTQYIYDLPTLNDPDREDIDNTHPNFPYPSGHPMYMATIDIGDPFGGDDSLNQSFAEPGGPVQVFSPGYRNAFDVVVRQDGKIYTFDNGPNTNWGGLPRIYDSSGTYKGHQEITTYNPENGDYITNEFNESAGLGHGDPLHYVGTINDDYGTYYGGHPNPIAAFPSRADLINYKIIGGQWVETQRYSLASTLSGASGYFNTSFDLSNFPDDPRQGKYLSNVIDSPDVNILDIMDASTNGICEYTATTFDGAMQGDILSASFDDKGTINRHIPNATGAALLEEAVAFQSCQTPALDITSLPDGHPFAGTIWTTLIYQGDILIFEPDFILCIDEDDPEYNPAKDYDSDGFSNQDEIDNGTNYCSGGSAPNDNDADFLSDFNDTDDDNDGIPDLQDAFALDPANGTTKNLPILYPFWNNDPGVGLFGLGFTGLMLNPAGTTDYLTQYNTVNMSFGGAAGKASIDFIPSGTAYGQSNSQEYAFQFGANVDSNSNPFTIQGRVESPFFSINGNKIDPVADQSVGFFIGTGDQDNYLKVVLQKGTSDNDAINGVQIVLEDQGLITHNTIVDIPNILNGTAVDFFINVDPQQNTAQVYASADDGSGTLITIGEPVQLPVSFLDATDNKGMAIGIIATSSGTTSDSYFATAWDFINVTEDETGVIEATPETIDFGVLSKDGNATQFIGELLNKSGPADPIIVIDEINISGTDSGLFSLTNNLPINLGSGAKLSIPVNVIPNGDIGIKTATLEIIHSGVNSPLYIPIAVDMQDLTKRPIYRINVGGAPVATTDIGPDWLANDAPGIFVGSGYTVTSGVISSANLNSANRDISIPDYIDDVTYNAIFKQERWDTGSAPEMEFAIKVPNGSYDVNLYLGNSYNGTKLEGSRIFDILIEGTIVQNDLDLITEFGHLSGGMLNFPVTVNDGELSISFGHEAGKDNPLLNAIEILGTSPLVFPISITPIANRTDPFATDVDFAVGATGGRPGESITYSILGQPDGILIEPTNGLISGIISNTALTGGGSHNGVHNVTVTASKPGEQEATINFTWTVIDPANGSWIDKEESENYTPRHECSFVQAGDKFFLMGGRSNENPKSIDVYDYKTDTWESVINIAPEEYNHFQATAYKGLIWIIGAFKTNTFPNETPADYIQIYNPTTQEWIQGPEIPESRRRGGAGVVLHNDKFYIVGGNTLGHNGQYQPWFDEYDPATGIWTALADAPNARDHFSAAVIDNKLYAAGGRLSGGPEGTFAPLVSAVDVYDFDTNTWSTLDTTNNIPTPRAGAAVVVFNDELLVIGGEGIDVPDQSPDPAFDVVEAYNPETNSWTTKAPLNHRRHGTQAIASGNGIYIVGGSPNRGGGNQKNMEVYSIDQPAGAADTPSILYTPDVVEFEPQETKNITISTVNGTTGIFIKSMTISGPDAASFSITKGELSNALLGDDTGHDIEITYAETTLGKTALLTITYDSGTTKTVQLNGYKTLYRINAGGTLVSDSILDWEPDQATVLANGTAVVGIPSPYLKITSNGDDITYGNVTSGFINNTGYPNALFDQERVSAEPVPDHMQWEFPVEPGYYSVNLLFAERFVLFQEVGKRLFDVIIEDNIVLDSHDQILQYGYNTAGVASFDVMVSDGTLDIDFIKVIQNPNIKGIEIIFTKEINNNLPEISTNDTLYSIEGTIASYQVEATDGDGGTQALTYSAVGLPTGLTIDENSGLISGTIAVGTATTSPYNVLITVTDNGTGALSATTTFIWNVSAAEINQGSVLSTVALQGRSDYQGIFNITFYNPLDTTTALYEFIPNSNSSGQISNLPIAQGTYKVAINHPGYLQRVVDVTVTGMDQALDFGQMKGGDINGDNEITIQDLSILISSFNKLSDSLDYIEGADLNRDDSVSILDLSILNSNFNTQGDILNN